MGFEYLEDITWADYAIRAKGETLEEVFSSAALGVMDAMIDVSTLGKTVEKDIVLEESSQEELLFSFLEELIVLKDSEQVLFSEFLCVIQKKGTVWELACHALGEKINASHTLNTDVKGVTHHHFALHKRKNGWEAIVVVDV